MRANFLIKRLDVGDYLDGSRVLIENYSLYKTKAEESNQAKASFDKAKAHMVDVFMAGIIEPRLSRKPNEPGTTYVEYLFTETELAIGLYEAIIEFTFGKKKHLRGSPNPTYSKLMR